MQWKDITNQYPGSNTRTPRVWQHQAGELSVLLYRHPSYGPDKWLATAQPFFCQKVLTSVDLEAAQKEVERLVRAALQEALDSL